MLMAEGSAAGGSSRRVGASDVAGPLNLVAHSARGIRGSRSHRQSKASRRTHRRDAAVRAHWRNTCSQTDRMSRASTLRKGFRLISSVTRLNTLGSVHGLCGLAGKGWTSSWPWPKRGSAAALPAVSFSHSLRENAVSGFLISFMVQSVTVRIAPFYALPRIGANRILMSFTLRRRLEVQGLNLSHRHEYKGKRDQVHDAAGNEKHVVGSALRQPANGQSGENAAQAAR